MMSEDTNTEIEDLELLEDNKLFKLAYWSKAVSWVTLAIGILNLILTIGRNFYSEMGQIIYGGTNLAYVISFLTPAISSLISTAVYFFLLQAVGEILFLMIDIREEIETRQA